MPGPQSVKEIDLTPVPGQRYFSSDREWREEFIYFLMVDRFQDDVPRPVAGGPSRSTGISTPNTFFGGKISGITRNLDYIAGLGCAAIWLSPVFENNPDGYHGYDINNYLANRLSFWHQARPHRSRRRSAQFQEERRSISNASYSRCGHQPLGR
jgi:hypothetical protein